VIGGSATSRCFCARADDFAASAGVAVIALAAAHKITAASQVLAGRVCAHKGATESAAMVMEGVLASAIAFAHMALDVSRT